MVPLLSVKSCELVQRSAPISEVAVLLYQNMPYIIKQSKVRGR